MLYAYGQQQGIFFFAPSNEWNMSRNHRLFWTGLAKKKNKKKKQPKTNQQSM